MEPSRKKVLFLYMNGVSTWLVENVIGFHLRFSLFLLTPENIGLKFFYGKKN